MNMDRTIRFCNPQMAGLFKFEAPAQMLGLDFLSLFSPEEMAFLQQQSAGYVPVDKAQEGHWVIRKDGSS